MFIYFAKFLENLLILRYHNLYLIQLPTKAVDSNKNCTNKIF